MKFSIIACVILAGFLICAAGYAQDDTFSLRLTQNTKTVYDLLKDEKEKELEISLSETIEARRAEYVKNYFMYYGTELKTSSISEESKNTAAAIPPRSMYYIPPSASEGGVDVNIIDWIPGSGFNPQNPEVVGYNVYRREFATSQWTLIHDNGLKVRYIDQSIDSGKAYQYEVRPYTAGGELANVEINISANYEAAYAGLRPENILVLVSTDAPGFVDIGQIVDGYETSDGKLDPITEAGLRAFLGYALDDPNFLTDIDGDGIANNAAWHVIKDMGTGEINVPLGVYYAIRRNIPKENIVFLDNIPTRERGKLTVAQFENLVVQPIKEHMVNNGITSKIASIASVYRFPIITDPSVPLLGAPPVRSWDDELSFRLWTSLGQESVDVTYRFSVNFPRELLTNRHFSRQLGTAGFLATRIDAQDLDTTRRMIDDAIWSEENYYFTDPAWRQTSDLTAFVDWKGPYTMGDDWFKAAADILNNSDLFGAQGNNWDMASDLNQIINLYDQNSDGRLDNTFLYTGWYNYYRYQDWFEWARGSIGWNLDSASGYSFRNWQDQGNVYGNAWGANIINRGATASLGAVVEPTLEGHTRPDLFMYYLLKGYTFAEASYYASSAPYNISYGSPGNNIRSSWTQAFDGDPLYNPFGRTTDWRISQITENGETINRLILSNNYKTVEGEDARYLAYRDYDLDGNLIRDVLPNDLAIEYLDDGTTLFYKINRSSWIWGTGPISSANIWFYDVGGELLSDLFISGAYYAVKGADMNEDGVIDAGDIVYNNEIYATVMQYQSRLDAVITEPLDKNGDTVIDNVDLEAASQFITYYFDDNIITRLRDAVIEMQSSGSFDENFDLNGDGILDENDVNIMAGITTLSEEQFIEAFTRLLTAVRDHLGLSSGDSNFIPALDTNGDGCINYVDYNKMRDILGEGRYDLIDLDSEIISAIEGYISLHPAPRSTSPNYDVDFDFNNDNRINSADQMLMRNIYYSQGSEFTKVFDKIMKAIRERIGLDTSSAKFISAFDVDKDGDIDREDCYRVYGALTEGRIKSSLDNKEVLSGIEAFITRMESSLPKYPNSLLDLNNDGVINEEDRLEVRYLQAASENKFSNIFNRILTAFWNHFRETSLNTNFASELDINKNGQIDMDDYFAIYDALAEGRPDRYMDANDRIVVCIEVAIRERATTPSVPITDPRYDVNLDLNDNRLVNSGDQILMRDVQTINDDQFIKVFGKIMTAIQERIGLDSSSSNFIWAFDADRDGNIDMDDFNKIRDALAEGRSAAVLSTALASVRSAANLTSSQTYIDPDAVGTIIVEGLIDSNENSLPDGILIVPQDNTKDKGVVIPQ